MKTLMLQKSDLLKSQVIDFSGLTGSRDDKRKAILELRNKLRSQFNTTEYDSPEKSWYASAFLEYLAFMYDTSFYDRHKKKYRIKEILDEGRKKFGGYDFIILWQSYPRLGIDDRNQFDYYRDMPGGLEGIKQLTDYCHKRKVRVFLNYNPWDTGTRREKKSDAEVLGDIIRQT